MQSERDAIVAVEAHMSRGDLVLAATTARDALAAYPDSAPLWHLLGNVRLRSGDKPGAEAGWREALVRDGSYVKSLNNLANLLFEAGRHEGALALYDRACESPAASDKTRINRATCLLRLGRARDAIAAFGPLVSGQDAPLRGLIGLARAHVLAGAFDEAGAVFARASVEHSDASDAWMELGVFSMEQHDSGRASEALERALTLSPDRSDVLVALGELDRRCERYQRAEVRLARAIELAPDLEGARRAHAALLFDLGRQNEAVAALDAAIARAAAVDDALELSSMRLFMRAHQDGVNSRDLLREHADWGRAALSSSPPEQVEPESMPVVNRPLRIGFLSPDFREHVVTRFLEPVLQTLPGHGANVVLCSTTRAPDAAHDRLAQRHRLIDLRGFPRARARQLLVDEQLDVMVDLAGHSSSDAALGLLVPRVAPLQVSYLGYPGTTGLDSIDARITDAWVDPPGTDDAYTETLLRLPRTAWAYVLPQRPDASRRERDRAVTFGCFNRMSKWTESTTSAWVEILLRVPEGRLTLRAKPLADASVRDRVREAFVRARVVDRVTLLPWAATEVDALAAYHDVDVVLDTFPYHGTTTTCDALTMGRPVVAWRGETPAARVASSLLASVGLGDLVATDARGYVERAVGLARDPARRARLAAELPARVRDGELGDPDGLARALLGAFRDALSRGVRAARDGGPECMLAPR